MLYDDHPLPGNENGSSNLERLDNIITFHLESCKGPCNHDYTTDDNALYDSDDSSMYSSGDSLNSGTSSIDLDDEDDVMEPVSEPESEVIVELKQQCIYAINNKLAAFPASLRYALIERVRNAYVREIFYWCQGLCDFYKKSLMSGNALEGDDHEECPSAQFYDRVLVYIAKTLGTDIMFCNFRGKCKRKPDGKNCMDPTPEEAIEIVDVIIALARLADALRGAVVLQICGGKKASMVMLPKLKKRMKSLGIGIIILNENSLHMSHYGYINRHVFFTQDLQQYRIYEDFLKMHVSLVEALKQLKKMGILDSTITFSQVLEWTYHLAGIKDHSHMPAEMMNAYGANYKKR